MLNAQKETFYLAGQWEGELRGAAFCRDLQVIDGPPSIKVEGLSNPRGQRCLSQGTAALTRCYTTIHAYLYLIEVAIKAESHLA